MRVVAVDGHAVHPDASTPGLTLVEAASALGTTPEAVRKRLSRGSLRGEKVDGRWHVHLPVRPDVPPADPEPPISPDRTTDRTPDARPDARDQLVEVLLADVAHLRDLVDRRDVELTAQRVTIGEMAARLADLQQPRPRRWWRPW